MNWLSVKEHKIPKDTPILFKTFPKIRDKCVYRVGEKTNEGGGMYDFFFQKVFIDDYLRLNPDSQFVVIDE